MNLFSRTVHPELFDSCATRKIEREHYRLTMQITTTGHLISFHCGGGVLTEICSGVHQLLPNGGRLLTQTIEAQHSGSFSLAGIASWESKFQIETVDARIFVTVQQHLAKQRDFEGLLHDFAPSGRMPLGAVSYINVQAFRRYVNVMSFHTFPDTCTVVRAETKFSLLK